MKKVIASLATGLMASLMVGHVQSEEQSATPLALAYQQQTIQAMEPAERTRLLVTENLDQATQILVREVSSNPDDVYDIVVAGFDAGAITSDVGALCQQSWPTDFPVSTDSLINDTVSAAIAANADPEVLIEECVSRATPTTAQQLMIQIFAAADPLEREGLIAFSLDAFEFSNIDGPVVLVNSLVEGNLLGFQELPEDCDDGCLRQIAGFVVNSVRVQTGQTQNVRNEVEQPLSES